MRFDITYRCEFLYDQPAAESQNELRAVPVTDQHQVVLHARVTTTPSARVLTTLDAWGTRVDAFGVRAPHDRLEILVEATVEVLDIPRVRVPVPLEALADADFHEEHRELLAPSPMAAPDDAVRALADELAEEIGEADVVTLAGALRDDVERRVEFVTGVTEVGTPIADVLAEGRGVCQDRAHLLIALARLCGIPARYVSGYLAEDDDGAAAGTHAWVEVAVPGEGWHTLDPCDGTVSSGSKIVIGRGRDYGDVAPLRGTYVGGESHDLEVALVVDEVVPVG